MESILEFLEPLTRLLCIIVLVILFFLFVVRPLLNYFIVNREIEHHKRLNEELQLTGSLGDTKEGPDDNEGQLAAATKGAGARSSAETLNRLASSDPDKAGDLVKKWVNSD